MLAPLFLGIDVGTQGVRVVLIDAEGNIAGSSEEKFELNNQSRIEQSPEGWWKSVFTSLKHLLNDSKEIIDPGTIKAVSVTSTSGTVIPIDENHQPIHNAIMYSDNRSEEEGWICRRLALNYNSYGYTGFNSSSGLSKILWFNNSFPQKREKISKWIHATDFIIGKLSGVWGITDTANVLKTGYDLHKNTWPEYIFEDLNLKKSWFPKVVKPGQVIGKILPSLASEFSLPKNLLIVAGITDGCASQIASGAVNPGEWNSTIGTTLVLKGVTRKEIIDPESRIYNHKHPGEFWMPGGASNIGADWVSRNFPDFADLELQSKELIPTGIMAYPLEQKGERFPFFAPNARGFIPENLTTLETFAACMEGVGYIERYALELIEKLSGEKVEAIFCAGGGSNSTTWLHIRSSILNLPLIKNKNVTGATGAAILAASNTHFHSVSEAVKALTQIEKKIFPVKNLVPAYEESYQKFIKLLKEKKYII